MATSVWLAGLQTERDAVVAGVNEVDAGKHGDAFAWGDRVRDEALGELIEGEHRYEHERRACVGRRENSLFPRRGRRSAHGLSRGGCPESRSS